MHAQLRCASVARPTRSSRMGACARRLRLIRRINTNVHHVYIKTAFKFHSIIPPNNSKTFKSFILIYKWNSRLGPNDEWLMSLKGRRRPRREKSENPGAGGGGGGCGQRNWGGNAGGGMLSRPRLPGTPRPFFCVSAHAVTRVRGLQRPLGAGQACQLNLSLNWPEKEMSFQHIYLQQVMKYSNKAVN